jgi:hypothetical protein
MPLKVHGWPQPQAAMGKFGDKIRDEANETHRNVLETGDKTTSEHR